MNTILRTWPVVTRRTPAICRSQLQCCYPIHRNTRWCASVFSRNGNIASLSQLSSAPSRHEQQSVNCGESSSTTSYGRVPIPWDGGEHAFSAVLLRDLCECPDCVHVSTKQKLYSTAEIPATIQARSVSPSKALPNAMDIWWSNDAPGFDSSHKTTVDLDLLKSISASGVGRGPFDIALPKPTPWKQGPSCLQDFTYKDYMKDDDTTLRLLQQLQTHGIAFISDVPSVEESVATIAERIGPVKSTFYGHTWDVRTVTQASNAAYTSSDLGFHTDLLYFQNPPHIQLLHCIQSASTGGASIFADAFQAATDLFETDIDSFNILATLPTNYHYKHPDSNMYHATKPVIDTRPLRVGDNTYSTISEFLQAWERGRCQVEGPTRNRNCSLTVFDCLEKINWGPPFLAPFSLEQDYMEQARSSMEARDALNQKMDRWHAAARKFGNLLHRPGLLHERLMKPGECVLFNNTRVLHSRRAFNSNDAGKPRWLRGTYVDKDPFFSKLRVLTGQRFA